MNRDELLEKLDMELAEWPVVKSCMQWDGDNFYPTDFMDRQPFSKIEWLAERERLINKPSWDELPPEANYLFQNSGGGLWFWSERPPNLTDHGWQHTGGDNGYIATGAIPAGHDWRQTLECRPTLTTSLGASGWDEDRIDIISSNGATGEHYSSEPACSCGSVVGEYHNPECSEVNAFQAGRINSADEAPAWSGEGLPTVGAECEAVWLEPPDGGSRDFEPVLIKGIHRLGNNCAQIWFCTTEGEDIVMLEGNCSFRPIRSDEDKVVDEMLGGSGFEGGVVRALCRALYRAGYRKLEVANE